MRSEFLFTNYIGEHPCAVIDDGRSDELIEKLVDGISKVARAFYPRPVVLRTSDFKTNEYHDMKGGADYEPNEDNPMIGWRGCSRYVSDSYREAFMCELKAIKKVRDELGFKNLNMMLPFVRTIEEVKDITAMMESIGLRRCKDFKLYFMAEIPVNIFMADEFWSWDATGIPISSDTWDTSMRGARVSRGPSHSSSRSHTRTASSSASADRAPPYTPSSRSSSSSRESTASP